MRTMRILISKDNSSPVRMGYTSERSWNRYRRPFYAFLAAMSFIYGALFAVFGTFLLLQLVAPFLVIAGLSIWLLPEVERTPRKTVAFLLWSFLLALICWPNYLALVLPGMPWITFIRLTSVPLALVLLIYLSVSAEVRRTLATVLNASSYVWKTIAIFMVIALVSIGLSANPAGSFSKFIVAQLYWTLIFIASCYVFMRPGATVTFSRIILICVVIVCVIALLEWRRQTVLWAGHIPSFLKVDDETLTLVLTASTRQASGVYRVKSVFSTPLGLAEFLAYSAPFLFYLTITKGPVLIRAISLISIPMAFYVVILTDSRLGMVGFFMTALMYLFAGGATRWYSNRRSIAGPLVVISYPAVLAVFFAASLFWRRLHNMVWGGGAQQFSSQARAGQMAAGLPKIWSHPWGYGIGQGGETLHYANQAGVFSIDSYYLSVALEYGVVGFIVYSFIFIFSIYSGAVAGLKARSPETKMLIPMVISLVNFIVIKSVFSQEGNHPLIFMILGATAALSYRVSVDLDSRGALAGGGVRTGHGSSLPDYIPSSHSSRLVM